jgi:2,4-dienoyl-CoA reductase-like NADH-dependent reductase (Old Yellow Enzyme family)
LFWWEACAVVQEGRANELQMMLTDENLGQFSALLEETQEEAARNNGASHRPANILQLTHSGRYSRPYGHKPAPIIPQHDPILDPRVGISPDAPLVSDAYLDDLIGHYAHSAKLAREAGFDGVDIKSCHRYLLSELLASHTRQGRYGGSFQNRTRFLRDAIDAVRRETGENFIIACRFNVFDAHPYPYGFGVGLDDFWQFDPDEPMALVRMLKDKGTGLLSNSAGNPYYIYPQVTRPFDQSSQGVPLPDEHPLQSVERLFGFTRMIQEEAGDIPVVGNGYTWLRQFAPQAGAANLVAGACQFVGLGRSSFAYPDAPRDILQQGGMTPGKCCTTCSKCTQIMRDHGTTGCVVRDAKVYAPLYKYYREQAEERAKA